MEKTQEQLLEEILKLKRNNPECEIKFCVYRDELLEEWSWTAHVIKDVIISDWFCDGERIYISKDDIIEHLYDKLCLDLSAEVAEKQAETMYKKCAKKTICVYTEPSL